MLFRSGYREDQVYAANGPTITERVPGNKNLPARFYRLVWHSPTGGPSVWLDLDAHRRKPVGFHFFALRDLVPNTNWFAIPTGRTNWNPIWASTDPRNNPAYARALVPIVFAAIDEYAARMGLAIPRPLTTNHVARFAFNDNRGWPHVEVFLTNHWQFIFRNSAVSGFKTPQCFFGLVDAWPMSVRDYVGTWRLSEAEAIKLAKQAVLKAGYPSHSLHLNETPEITKPEGPAGSRIPRYYIEWRHFPVKDEEFTAWTRVEVNADRGTVESVYHDAMELWGKKPPIDLPLSLPP